ncbi:unnamed protein product [Brachionus calyciflorus]|uniref:Ubiquitin-like protease family profile domain-containing protein n=1 Tax=Brachionus calyciflorus TaxID=104777 RepID=A0A814GB85_9BILA|nr:unnamed protein product [Brachionus calyciflorus]
MITIVNNGFENLVRWHLSHSMMSKMYFVNTWLQGKYGFSWNHIENNGPRTNNQNEDNVGKKRKRKIVFENPLKDLEFLKRIDFVNIVIKQDQPNNEQASELFSKELFTILKSQIHIYKTFILNDQPTGQDLFDALIKFSDAHLVKSEPIEKEEPSEKRQKLDDPCEIQSLESQSYRLSMPDYYTLENTLFNLETIHDSIFIQVLHAENHWIVLANLHPPYEDSDGFNNWFIYDSLNNPKNYLNRIKTVLKRFSGGSRFFDVIHVNVTKQKGNKDCGLFALGYALSLAMNLDTGKLILDQKKSEMNLILL